MDLLPKLVAQAAVSAVVRVVRYPRPERLVKELRRQLPNHDIRVESSAVDGPVVVIRSPNRACVSAAPTCTR